MRPSWPRLLGACVQGAITGLLLAMALLRLLDSVGGTRLFRYQGF